MVHKCILCDMIVSDEANDFSLTEEGEPICDACVAEELNKNWWVQQDQDDYANQRPN